MAQHGGSTSICTSAETTSRSCNSNTCRKSLSCVSPPNNPIVKLNDISKEVSLVFLIQLLDVERIWIGTSAQAATAALTNRATVTTMESAPRTTSVGTTTAGVTGVTQILVLTAVFQVTFVSEYLETGPFGPLPSHEHIYISTLAKFTLSTLRLFISMSFFLALAAK